MDLNGFFQLVFMLAGLWMSGIIEARYIEHQLQLRHGLSSKLLLLPPTLP
jgi:hypothetical protein